MLGCIVAFWAYLSALELGSYPLIFLTGVLFAGFVYSGVNGLWPAFFTEMFRPSVRYSGFAIGTQIGFLIGGFAPMIAAALAGAGKDGWMPVLVFAAVAAVISAIGAATARETAFADLHELGHPSTRAEQRAQRERARLSAAAPQAADARTSMHV